MFSFGDTLYDGQTRKILAQAWTEDCYNTENEKYDHKEFGTVSPMRLDDRYVGHDVYL
jgi:hypothetical protein